MTAVQLKDEGNVAFQQDDFETAISKYTQAIDMQPAEGPFYSNRSAAYLKSGRARMALTDAQKCVELKPTWFKGHFRIGEAYMHLKLYAKAADAFAAALEQAPEMQELQENLREAESMLRQKQSQAERSVMTPPPETLPSKEEQRSFTASLGRQGPAIMSMEDYMRFREAGGSKTKADESSFLAKAPDNYVPTKSKADFLASLGINNHESMGSTGMESSGRSGSAGGGGGADASMSTSSRLAQARAEQAAMLAGQGAGGGGGASDWSKIRGTDGGAAAASSPSPAAQMGNDWSRIRGSDAAPAAAGPPSRERERAEPSVLATPQSAQGRVRAADLPSSASGAASRGDFIAAMGLDMRGSDVIDYGSQRPTSAERPGSYTSGGNYNDSPDKAGTVGSASSYEPTLGGSRHSSRPSTPGSVSAAKARMAEKLAAVGGGAAGGPQVFGGMFDNKELEEVPDSVKHLIRDVPSPAPSVDYKALGAQVGAGDSYKANLLNSFRGKKAVDPNLQAGVGDERLEQVKTEFADFSYRKFREDPNATRLDHVTKNTVVGDAILAEAMSGYDYRKMVA